MVGNDRFWICEFLNLHGRKGRNGRGRIKPSDSLIFRGRRKSRKGRDGYLSGSLFTDLKAKFCFMDSCGNRILCNGHLENRANTGLYALFGSRVDIIRIKGHKFSRSGLQKIQNCIIE